MYNKSLQACLLLDANPLRHSCNILSETRHPQLYCMNVKIYRPEALAVASETIHVVWQFIILFRHFFAAEILPMSIAFTIHALTFPYLR